MALLHDDVGIILQLFLLQVCNKQLHPYKHIPLKRYVADKNLLNQKINVSLLFLWLLNKMFLKQLFELEGFSPLGMQT